MCWYYNPILLNTQFMPTKVRKLCYSIPIVCCLTCFVNYIVFFSYLLLLIVIFFQKLYIVVIVPSRPRVLTNVKVKVKHWWDPPRGLGEKVNRLTTLGVAKGRRRQVWASPCWGVANVTPRCPRVGKTAEGGDTVKGNGMGEEASGPGTSEQ